MKKKATATAKTFVNKAPTKKRAARTCRVNREGQRWTENRVGMTLRLPSDLEVDVRQVALDKGDLSRIVLFAMEHISPKDVALVKTRKADLGLGRPMLLHIGAQARAFLRTWAEREAASVNQVVVSLLEKFFCLTQKECCAPPRAGSEAAHAAWNLKRKRIAPGRILRQRQLVEI